MPSWRGLERFYRRDGWTEVKKKGHHIYFQKIMTDKSIARYGRNEKTLMAPYFKGSTTSDTIILQ